MGVMISILFNCVGRGKKAKTLWSCRLLAVFGLYGGSRIGRFLTLHSFASLHSRVQTISSD